MVVEFHTLFVVVPFGVTPPVGTHGLSHHRASQDPGEGRLLPVQIGLSQQGSQAPHYFHKEVVVLARTATRSALSFPREFTTAKAKLRYG